MIYPPGHLIRLKRRKQLRGSQSEKTVNEQNPEIISCPDIPNDSDANKKAELQRVTGKPGKMVTTHISKLLL